MDLRQAIADIVLLACLVLADDRVQRHLAEMPGILSHPAALLDDEAGVVEHEIALQWTAGQLGNVGWRNRAPFWRAASRSSDQAAYSLGLLQCHLLEDHATERDAKPDGR